MKGKDLVWYTSKREERKEDKQNNDLCVLV
jgi:hypothetical protein